MIILPFLHVWGLTLVLAVLFACAGGWVRQFAFARREAEGPFYEWGLSYFLGVFVYLFLLRLFDAALGSARLACYLTLLILVFLAVLAVRGRRSQGLAVYLGRVLPVGVLLFGVYTVTTLGLWTSGYLGLESGTAFGSGHSGRYSNIGLVTVQRDAIPRIGQNYAQSILVATHLLLGTASPLASLTAWVALSLAMLALFLYGLFRQALPSGFLGGLAVFLVMGCNVALSLTFVCVLTNGSPIMFMPYSDMVMAVATCIVFVIWLGDWVRGGEEASYAPLLVPVLLGAVWNWCSPENIVTSLGLCFTLVLLALVWPAAFPRRRLVLLSVVLAAAVGVGATQGGMFMPKGLALHDEIPGVAQWAAEAAAAVRFEPGLEFLVNANFATEFVAGQYCFGRYYHAQGTSGYVWTYGFETALWLALRIMFFPILGIAGLGLLAFLRNAPLGGLRPETLRLWSLCAGIVFLGGFLIEFCLAYQIPQGGDLFDSKWDLARFLIPGVTLSLVCLVFFTQAVAQGLARPLRTVLWLGLAALCTFGPVVAFARTFWSNGVLAADGASWIDRLRVLFHTREVLPETYFDRLVAALKADNVQARREAALGLAFLGAGAEKAVESLTASLGDADAEVRRLAALALVKIQGSAAVQAVPELHAALKSGEAQVRREAADALAEIGPEARAAAPALTRLAQNERGPVQWAAAYTLMRIQGAEAAPAALPGLLDALRKGDAFLRQRVALSLPTLGPAAQEAAEALAALLTDADVATRRTVALALVQIEGAARAEAVLPVLSQALQDPDAAVRRHFVWTLASLGPAAAPAADAVTQMLTDEDEDTRRTAACALAWIKGPEAVAAVPVLVEGLKDGRRGWRLTCAEALGRLGPAAAEAASALAEARRNAEEFGAAAAAALKKIQEK